jgi:hypothetical protein
MASVQRLTGTPVRKEYTCTNATATEFYRGDLVKLDGSGTLVVATSGSILGIAEENHPGSVTGKVTVDIIVPDGSLFAMTVSGSTAVSDLGEIQTITFTAGAHTIADGSNDFIPVALIDAAGTSGGREAGMFKYSSLQAVTGF